MNVGDLMKSAKNYLLREAGHALQQGIKATERDGYLNGREEGITNAVAALYDANVSDNEIIRVLHKFWHMSESEARQCLISEKAEATIREMYDYLSLQGYLPGEIHQFSVQTSAKVKIRANPKLWSLRRNPKKLVEILQGKNPEQSVQKASKKQNRK